MNLLGIFWNLLIESAPWLLIGYLLAGIIKQVIPSEWVHKQMAKPGFVSIVKGAFIGAPLPLCSCGVIPTALAVRKAGASKGATSSFFSGNARNRCRFHLILVRSSRPRLRVSATYCGSYQCHSGRSIGQ